MRQVMLATVLLALCACASMGDEPPVPAGAVETTRVMENGDTVSEYRVQGQLSMVRVAPKHGPVYYLIDRNGDGRLDAPQGAGPISPVYFKLYGW